MPTEKLNTGFIDGIPLVWIEPKGGAKPSALCLWLPGFSGTKESVEPQLRALAASGLTAVSFDPWQHGERLVESRAELQSRILSNIRRYFWPILANTAEESSRVIDWAIGTLGVDVKRGVRMGGISMGGDISVAAAGLDPRIRRVAACVATPDWLRPGSHEPPGVPDTYAWLCYTRGNPMTNIHRYAHRPAITFQCGQNDTQVPPDGAQRFAAAMTSLQAAPDGTLDVTLHEGTGHAFTPAMWERSLAWLSAS